jgi:SNF2 family DNA or RNA helicase
MARAHRIGQKKKVMVYQFVTANSIEDAILKRSKNKIALETIVIAEKKTTRDVTLKGIAAAVLLLSV